MSSGLWLIVASYGGLEVGGDAGADVLGEAVAQIAHGLAVQGSPDDAVVEGKGCGGSGLDVTADADVHEAQGGHDVEGQGGVQAGAGNLEWMCGKAQCHLTGSLALMTAQTVNLGVGYDGGIARKDAVDELLLDEGIGYHGAGGFSRRVVWC